MVISSKYDVIELTVFRYTGDQESHVILIWPVMPNGATELLLIQILQTFVHNCVKQNEDALNNSHTI